MGRVIIRRVRSASLLETLIAMVILISILYIAVTIFVNADVNAISYTSITAKGLIDEYIVETDTNKQFSNEEKFEYGFKISREKMEMQIGGEIVVMSFTARDSSGILKAERFAILSLNP